MIGLKAENLKEFIESSIEDMTKKIIKDEIDVNVHYQNHDGTYLIRVGIAFGNDAAEVFHSMVPVGDSPEKAEAEACTQIIRKFINATIDNSYTNKSFLKTILELKNEKA